MDTWVRVMADYCSDGVWYRDGCAMCAGDLPISVALRDRLAAWCAAYEKNTDYLPADHPDWRPFQYFVFADEGRRVAEAIKAELPEWTVIYFDEAELMLACAAQADANRQLYEREIEAATEALR